MFFDSGTQKPIFKHLKMGTFGKSAHFQVPENGTFAFLVFFHINTTYIKLDWNSDNFFTFWCTLMRMVMKLNHDNEKAHDL